MTDLRDELLSDIDEEFRESAPDDLVDERLIARLRDNPSARSAMAANRIESMRHEIEVYRRLLAQPSGLGF